MKRHLLIFLRGLLMGMADIIPGVSGGTIALITGIYERLIFAIKGINIRFILHMLHGNRRKSREELLSMDLDFLATLFLGIVVAFLLLSGVIRFLMAAYPANTYAFFFGLILASAGFVYRYVRETNLKVLASGVIGFLTAVVIIGLGSLQYTHSLPVIFFSGFIAICAMLLPGISGAFILFFLGQYEYMLGVLHLFDLPTMAVFITGAVIGLFVMARILSYLLKNYRAVTMSFLAGLMIGALRMPFENIISNVFFLPFVLASATAGFFTVVILERLADRFHA